MSLLKKPAFYLAASLGANIFLVGFLLGQCGAGGPGGKPPRDFKRPDGPPGPERMLQDFSRGLNGPDADKLKSIFADKGKAFAGHRDNIKGAMGKVADVLNAETVDKVALTEALAGIAVVNSSLHEAMSGIILRAADDLTLEGRRQFAETLKRGPGGPDRDMKHGPRGEKGDRRHGGPPAFMKDGAEGPREGDLPPPPPEEDVPPAEGDEAAPPPPQ